MKKASEREKAILFALAAGYVDTWEKAFILSRQDSEEAAGQLKSRKSSVTHWKQHPQIIQAYQNARAVIEANEERIKAAALLAAEEERNGQKETTGPADNNRAQSKRAAAVDYYNPENQRRTINAIIERSNDDPKTQLDAIKAIQQTQRDDRQAAKDNQIQRFYTPVTCKICPLYQKRVKKS